MIFKTMLKIETEIINKNKRKNNNKKNKNIKINK